jgi:hypothetical protein
MIVGFTATCAISTYRPIKQISSILFYFQSFFEGLGQGYGVKFQQYFSYIVAVNFTGGGNRSAQRNTPTCCKSLTNFIT